MFFVDEDLLYYEFKQVKLLDKVFKIKVQDINLIKKAKQIYSNKNKKHEEDINYIENKMKIYMVNEEEENKSQIQYLINQQSNNNYKPLYLKQSKLNYNTLHLILIFVIFLFIFYLYLQIYYDTI